MRINNSLIELFFASDNKNFILNILYVLKFMLQVSEHQNRFNEIFAEAGVDAGVKSFSDIVNDTIDLYKLKLEENDDYLMKDFTIKAEIINRIENTPIFWLFIAMYWGYDFKNQTNDAIFKGYNWRIGDIALKFLLYFLKMERQTLSSGKSSAKGFFPDLAARLVRIVDILIAMSKFNNRYINNIYFQDKDLAQNFLEVQCHNPWLCDAFTVVKNTHIGRGVFQFYHEEENIKFYAIPTRMAKSTALNGLCETQHALIGLYNLRTKKSSHIFTGIKIPKEKSSTPPSPAYEFVEIVDGLSSEIIYIDSHSDVGPDADADIKAEVRAKAKGYTRHTKPLDSDEENNPSDKEYVIPNGHVQHKRNRAFSSSVTKQNLLLPSDYNIPPVEQLKEFIRFLQKGVQNV